MVREGLEREKGGVRTESLIKDSSNKVKGDNINKDINITFNPISKHYPNISFGHSYYESLDKFSKLFGLIFNKKVEFDIIKLQFPFHDSNILAKVLGYNANKYKFTRMIKLLLPRSVIKNPSVDIQSLDNYEESNRERINLISPLGSRTASAVNFKSSYLSPIFESIIKEISARRTINSNTRSKKYKSYLSGMNIKLAGRLMTQGIRPRFTVQNKQEGSLARVKVHSIQNSRFTGKNKRGAFSFNVTISHVFNKGRI